MLLTRFGRKAALVAAASSTLVGVTMWAVPAQAAPQPGIITAGGSDTTEQLMDQYMTTFESNGEFNVSAQPGVGGENVPAEGGQCDTNGDGQVNWATASPPGEKVAPNGSSSGINEINAQAVAGQNCLDIARSSRGPRATDDPNLRFYNFALDAVWPMTPGWYAPEALTKQQIKDIYLGSPVGTCSVTNWNQVGGATFPITAYLPQAGSGTRAEFVNRWLDLATDPGVNGFPCVPAARQNAEENTGEAPSLTSGGTLPGAITAYSAGKWVRQANNFNNATIDNRNGFRPILVNEAGCGGVATPLTRTAGGSWSLNATVVTSANADSNACPGVRFLWNVVRNDAPQAAQAKALVGLGSSLCAGTAGTANGLIRGQGFLPNACQERTP